MKDINEIINLFGNTTLPLLNGSKRLVNINFIFDDSIINLIRYNPNKEYFLKDNNSNEDIITINIDDSYKFFELLTILYNELVNMNDEIFHTTITDFFKLMSTKLFLRMTPYDIENIYEFLERQIEFAKSREFSDYRFSKKVGMYDKYNIDGTLFLNPFCESNQAMTYKLYTEDKIHEHELAKIDYDICYENGSKVCYISAIQNKRGRYTDKKIERSLYKLNKGINSDVHPNQVLPLILFTDLLLEHKIDTIKVPIINPLDYDFHKILGNIEKEMFDLKWKDVKDKEESYFYQFEKETVDHTYQKEDYISYLKTEKLFKLMDRLSLHRDVKLINDIDNNNGFLIYKLM